MKEALGIWFIIGSMFLLFYLSWDGTHLVCEKAHWIYYIEPYATRATLNKGMPYAVDLGHGGMRVITRRTITDDPDVIATCDEIVEGDD